MSKVHCPLQAAYEGVLKEICVIRQRIQSTEQGLQDIQSSKQLQRERQQAEAQKQWQAAALQVVSCLL